MQLILTVLHLVLAIGLIGLILIQHGKGADAGAAFGSGASATVFGAQGSGSFLSRTTGVMAALFFFTSIALAYYAARVGEPAGLMDGIDEEVPISVPAVVPALPEVETDLPPAELGFDEPMTGSVGDDLPPMDAPDMLEPAEGEPEMPMQDVPGADAGEPDTVEPAEDDSASPPSDEIRSEGGSN